jgi:heavy metal sensor kinase
MSLTTRLSSFFLAALAVVLLAFSATLYLSARSYLMGQADERLAAALETLAAAAEILPEGVEWEPKEHRLALGQETGLDHVRWTVHQPDGKLVEQSGNLKTGVNQATHSSEIDPLEFIPAVASSGKPWRLSQRLLKPSSPAPAPAAPESSTSSETATVVYPQLLLTAGVSLAPIQATLNKLLLALTGLCSVTWLLAAILGRELCRRAIGPVTQMAAVARSIDATDLRQRLPDPESGDEIEALSKAFNGVLTRLEDAFERQRRFTGDASHQLRTPLTAMLGQIEVVLRRDRPAEDYREVLTKVHSQGEHLRQIVETLLFLARADKEACLAELDTVDLASWLPERLQQWSSQFRAPDLSIQCSGPCWVRVQAPLLGQLLDNLVENACKYSPPATAIEVRVERAPEGIILKVEDRGSGIGPEDLPHIFEPFYRSARARQLGRSGVGLGLAVAQRIAKLFGGTLTAESELGRWTRLTLRLPAAAPAALPAALVAS